MGDRVKLVSIKSPNHSQELVNGLWNFFNTKYRVDFSVEWSGRTMRAHQLIIDVFLPPETREQNMEVLRDDRIKLDLLLEFMYKGEVKVPRQDLDNLFVVAKKLGFDSLAEAAENARRGRVAETPKRKGKSVKKSSLASHMVSKATTMSKQKLKQVSGVEASLEQQTLREGEGMDEWQDIIEALRTDCTSPATDANGGESSGTAGKGGKRRRSTRNRLNVDGSVRQTKTKAKTRAEYSRLYRQRLPLVKCQFCSYMTRDRRNYGSHYNKHHPTEMLPFCSICKTTFFDYVSLDRHMTKSHSTADAQKSDTNVGEPASTPSTVDSGATSTNVDVSAPKNWPTRTEDKSTPDETERRRMYVLSKPLVKCQHCNYSTRDKRYYATHMNRHHPGVPVPTCHLCDQKFFDQASLAEHLAKPNLMVHSAEYMRRAKQMRLSGENLAQREAKKLAARESAKPKPMIECELCDYVTYAKSNYSSHLTHRHPDQAAFKCDSCQWAFVDAESLAHHQAKMLGSCTAVHRCPHCCYQSKVKGSMRRHLYTQHGIGAMGKPVQRKHKCTECDYEALIPSQLKKHFLVRHSGLKPYECQRCSYSTNHKGALKKHVEKIHLGLKPFICEICAHRSSTKHNLDRHHLTHTGERPYPCSSCELAFADRYTLKAHIRARHTHEKPHVCHVCSHAFCNLTNLRRHLKIHD